MVTKMALSPHATIAKTTVKSKNDKVLEIIHFEKEGDKARASTYSMQLLGELRVEAGINQLVITSAIRTEEEQAHAMYDNELVRSLHLSKADKEKPLVAEEDAGVSVINSLGRLNGAAGSVVSKREVGNLPHHKSMGEHLKAAKANDIPYKSDLGKEVKGMARADVASGSLHRAKTEEAMSIKMKKGGLINITRHAGVKNLEVFDISIKMTPDQRKKFMAAVKSRFGSSIYRFGYPNAPAGVYTFNDKCFHIEIRQPERNDAPANKKFSAIA